ncbi:MULTISPECIES: hypothetical protein [unclassified Methylocaldum]|uniref:hypothetical protein n=1 Tax=unclassified Methylocaldum TaxID=2622260 RepID=UPI0012EB0A13|nr:hypothetical protein [Methylocaldum sp. RMAD-M]MBP1151844.1 hypothetical protein [Methylocaldum sp. RMAD-M]MVF23945.1 hypothetical protein [Methylocaldum sp. BRCS4]
MNPEHLAWHGPHLLGETATHPIARRAGRLAALLLAAGDYPAASSRPFDGAQDRLAIRPTRSTLGHAQLPFLG